MKLTHLMTATTLTALLANPVFAAQDEAGHSHNHDAATAGNDHASMDHAGMSHGNSKMFLEKRDIDGYSVSFHVMEANEGMQHGGTHNLMIKVEQGSQVITDLKANSKVVYPGGGDESKPLMKMGDWFMAGYDLKGSGKHQLMVLFKTADGKKHFGGVYYGE